VRSAQPPQSRRHYEVNTANLKKCVLSRVDDDCARLLLTLFLSLEARRQAFISIQSYSSLDLGYLSPNAPGLRFEDKRTVVPVPEQAFSHARLELTAAFVSKGHDVRTSWAGPL
jgi:hypothetical protein